VSGKARAKPTNNFENLNSQANSGKADMDFARQIEHDHQHTVNTYFQATAHDWENIYSERSVYAVIHQQRQACVLAIVDQLGLALHRRILEVGCGAGLTTTALARRGYQVSAVDAVQAMLDLTRRRVTEAVVTERVTTALADVRQLAFPDKRFGLVLAIGVLPWVDSLCESVREMQRVTEPGGYLIVTVDNRWRLNEMLDPRLNPIHAPIRHLIRRLGYQKGMPETQRCSSREFDTVLGNMGYAKLRGIMLGFGPFSLFGQTILPDRVGVKAHNTLQRFADRNVPLLRSVGTQYLVLAKVRD
jgi:ubiquinone/menaquinone biosynthesis C-methylase UbiE